MDLFEMALKMARYAIKCKNRNLVYQAYGFANGVRLTGGITKEQFLELNEMLVKNCMNNGPVWSTFD